MKEIGGAVLGIVLFIGAILALDYSSLMWESFIGPKRENVRRQIFEETKSYNQGMLQDLVRYRKEYMMSKSPEDKAVICNTVSHMMADYNENKLPSELRIFLSNCKYGDPFLIK